MYFKISNVFHLPLLTRLRSSQSLGRHYIVIGIQFGMGRSWTKPEIGQRSRGHELAALTNISSSNAYIIQTKRIVVVD